MSKINNNTVLEIKKEYLLNNISISNNSSIKFVLLKLITTKDNKKYFFVYDIWYESYDSPLSYVSEETLIQLGFKKELNKIYDVINDLKPFTVKYN
jgi:hypothetical protein